MELENKDEKRIVELVSDVIFHKSWKKPSHGICCTCQQCGYTYDDCKCDCVDNINTTLEIINIMQEDGYCVEITFNSGIKVNVGGYVEYYQFFDNPHNNEKSICMGVCLTALAAKGIFFTMQIEIEDINE